MNKNFKAASSARSAKATSDSKKGKAQDQQQKAQEVVAQNANGKGSNPKANSQGSDTNPKKLFWFGYGTPLEKIKGYFETYCKKECKGKDKKCKMAREAISQTMDRCAYRLPVAPIIANNCFGLFNLRNQLDN